MFCEIYTICSASSTKDFLIMPYTHFYDHQYHGATVLVENRIFLVASLHNLHLSPKRLSTFIFNCSCPSDVMPIFASLFLRVTQRLLHLIIYCIHYNIKIYNFFSICHIQTTTNNFIRILISIIGKMI